MFIMHCHNICLAIDETKVTLLTLSAFSGKISQCLMQKLHSECLVMQRLKIFDHTFYELIFYLYRDYLPFR